MKRHKWTEEDLKLLEESVEKCGIEKGSKIAAKKIDTTPDSAKTTYYQKIKKLTKHAIPVTNPEKLKDVRVKKPNNARKTRRILTNEEETLLAECIKNRVRNSSDGITKILRDMSRMFDISERNASSKWNGEMGYTGALYKHTMFTEEELESLLNRKRANRRSYEKEIEIAKYLKMKVAESPNNLIAAFKDTQKHFGFKNVASITCRWYGYRNYNKYPSCRDNIGPAYIVTGDNTTVNGKNKKSPDVKKTNWIMNIFRKWINKEKK